MPFFRAPDGVKLYYEVWGSGEPLLLVEPGLFARVDQAAWLRPLIQEGLTVLAYDKRGMGRSDQPPAAAENYSQEVLYRDSLALTDLLAPESVIALGWFEGTWRAVRRALERPTQTAGIVLCGPALADLPISEAFDETFRKLVETGVGYALPAFVEAGMPDATPAQKDLALEMLSGSTTNEVAATMWRAVEQASEDAPPDDELLGQVSCPALVVAGTADIVVPLDYARRVAELIPAARLATIEGAGSAMWFTRPRETLAEVRQLVLSLAAAPRGKSSRARR